MTKAEFLRKFAKLKSVPKPKPTVLKGVSGIIFWLGKGGKKR